MTLFLSFLPALIILSGAKPFELTSLALLPDPVRFTIYDPAAGGPQPFHLLGADSTIIDEPVHAAILYFWNHSAFNVQDSDITEPIKLSLDDSHGRILKLTPLRSTGARDLVRLERSPENPEKEVRVSFEKLAPRQGIAFQVIYTGDLNTRFLVDGSTRGMSGIATDYRQTVKPFWGQYGKIIGLGVLAIILIPLYIYRRRRLARQKQADESLLSPIQKSTTTLFLRVLQFGFIVLLLWLLVVQPLLDAQKRPYKILYKSVPESLVP
ncbi:hypothetical protein KKA00_03730 [bacterium]|nr:hypothetical protein [bacterium]